MVDDLTYILGLPHILALMLNIEKEIKVIIGIDLTLKQT